VAAEFKEIIVAVGRELKFELGRCVITVGADAALREIMLDPISLLLRHVTGDWEELSKADQAENRRSITKGYRILSAYTLEPGIKFYVITEHDRSYTTIMLASEY
jgi:hypothetical protein